MKNPDWCSAPEAQWLCPSAYNMKDCEVCIYSNKEQTMLKEGYIRKFETGATRDTAKNKLDYEGFLSPLVLQRFAEYMDQHRIQSDGTLRDSDNWQKGIPLAEYMKSGFRHFIDWWLENRQYPSREGLENALCGVMFNAMGYLHEILKDKLLAQYETAEKKTL